MSTRHLECLFRPRAVVVIGGSIAAALVKQLRGGGFAGEIMQAVREGAAWTAIAGLPLAPDLALIGPDVDDVPQLIDALGQRGTRAAILFGTQVAVASTVQHVPKAVRSMPAILAAARPYRLRLLGPGSAGLMVPALGLHASLIPLPQAVAGLDAVHGTRKPVPGKLAFVSQSGALASAVLDWSSARGIGFSKCVTVGAGDDVDIADLLDFLARDPLTEAILLYVEQITHARKFLSAARAAARGKPVVILKAGRAPEAAHAAASHAGVLIGTDDAADAAIRRAGMLRVYDIMDLFGAAQILAHAKRLGSERLLIVSNGTGPGLLAADALVKGGGQLAALPASLAAGLLSALGPSNPVNLGFGANVDDYTAAMRALLPRPGNDAEDAILLIHTPSASAPAVDVAHAAIATLAASGRTVLSCWLGGQEATAARRLCNEAGVPAYGTPENAIAAFLQMVEYRRNQALLMQVPPSIRGDATPRYATARSLIDTALAAGRMHLSEPESKALLAAYGIPVVRTLFAPGIDDAIAAAETIGFPVALKIVARGILHKSDVGGVALDLGSASAVAEAGRAMQLRLKQHMPAAAIDGFSVQAMARRVAGHELIVGVTTDPVFGPVILFGQGGIAVEVMDDKAVGLPPLNMLLARDMVSRTRVARLLAGYRNLPAADLDAICQTLVQVACLVSDLAEVVELDINPLLASPDGVIALDAHVRLARATVPTRAGVVAGADTAFQRLAIPPYPQELEQWIEWQGTRLLLRPIRPEDGQAHLDFVHALQPDDVRYRMFVAMRQLPPAQLARFTQIDYDREMAFIATRPQSGPSGQDAHGWETLGVARVVIDAATNEAEFAIIVRSDLKGHGLGTMLMQKLIAYCRSRGVEAIVGEALSDNGGLRRLVKRLGFTIDASGDQGVRGLRLRLGDEVAAHEKAGGTHDASAPAMPAATSSTAPGQSNSFATGPIQSRQEGGT